MGATERKGRKAGLVFWLPTEEVREDPANENLHTEAQVAEAAESLRAFGQQRSIVVTADNLCTAGHRILRAARLLGLPRVKCKLTVLAGADRAAYRQADNLSARLSYFDQDKLSLTLRGVAAEAALPAAALGFDEESYQLALDRTLFGGRVIDLGAVGAYDEADETLVFKVEVPEPEAARLCELINRELEGTGYVAAV
jgi:hypothetical protein